MPIKTFTGFEDEVPTEEFSDEGEECPECGAPPGMPHDPGCPNAEQVEPDPDRYREGVDRRNTLKEDKPSEFGVKLGSGKHKVSLTCPECGAGWDGDSEECGECGHTLSEGKQPSMFDKFMESTLLKESKALNKDSHVASPQRRLARNYQEHPLGKIRMGGKR